MDEVSNEDKTGESPRSKEVKSLRQNLLEWLGILAACAVMLFFFAPESWWQFGVAPEAGRKDGAELSLRKLNADGESWNFDDQRGRVVVVNYWATWCPPCRIETPGLVSVANEYKPRGVELVGVTLDEDLPAVLKFVDSYKIPYEILLPGRDPNLGGTDLVLPTTFLYDKKGKIAKKYTGLVLASTLRSDIETLLAEE